jgi:xylulose-5-phosphate/fructose-6-phosphate phosphoketolase
MQIRNGTSRYHIVMQAVAAAGTRLDANRKEQVMEHYARKIVDHRRYINTHGEDPPEVRDWNWI